jgi:imidazolonepropionase-like amidohydrolase
MLTFHDTFVNMVDSPRTALTNVRVFDGRRLLDPGTVVIEADRIGTDASGARVVDCAGSTLLPGLIDAHMHLHGRESLDQLSSAGVTTALDMASWPASLVDSLRGQPGLTDIRSAGLPAVAPGGSHTRIPGFPSAAVVAGPADAAQFVADRVTEGSDYLKILVDAASDTATVTALVTAAHRHGMLAVAHTVLSSAVDMALEAQVDVITHAPLDIAIDEAVATRMATEGRVAIPTLTMMAAVAASPDNAASTSVGVLHRAGVPVLAGTDANATPGVPAAIPHGQSLHDELALLVGAGLSTTDALRAATVLPARHFGLADRGAVEPGMRADLVLIAGDPVADITATRLVERVWCAGRTVAQE